MNLKLNLKRHIAKGLAALMIAFMITLAPSTGVYAEGYNDCNDDGQLVYGPIDDNED